MPYTSEITKILADQLAKFVTLRRDHLAGQVANLDFWMAEVQHCLEVIDGYPQRFERMKNAQADHVTRHQTREFDLNDPFDLYEGHRTSSPSPPRRIEHEVLSEDKRLLREAARRFLIRCYHERLIDETDLKRRCDRIGTGIESRELRRGPRS